jgi:hypothetical protein
MMRPHMKRLSAIASILAMVACSSSDDNNNAGDAGADAAAIDSGSDTSVAVDGGEDEAAVDASVASDADSSVDAGSDAAASEAATEAGVDAAIEAASEAASEAAVVEAGSDAAPDVAVQNEASTVDATAVSDAPAVIDAYVQPGCTPPSHDHITPTSATILDMERTDLFTQAVPQNLAGNWDQLLPAPDGGVKSGWEFSVLTPPRNGSNHAIHSTGSAFPAYDPSAAGGVGIALLGEFAAPLDASMYTGVSFWAKGSNLTKGLRVVASLTTVLETYCACEPAREAGGTGCNDVPYKDVDITDNWAQYTVKWADFRQEGWGNPVATDPRNLLNFLFRNIAPTQGGVSGSWDFWLDDVTFSSTP